MSVVAKFKVDSIEGTQVLMSAVMKDSDNRDWSQYTPAGSINMNITNPTALDYFKVGNEHTLTFS